MESQTIYSIHRPRGEKIQTHVETFKIWEQMKKGVGCVGILKTSLQNFARFGILDIILPRNSTGKISSSEEICLLWISKYQRTLAFYIFKLQQVTTCEAFHWFWAICFTEVYMHNQMLLPPRLCSTHRMLVLVAFITQKRCSPCECRNYK